MIGLGIRKFIGLYSLRNVILKDAVGYYSDDSIVREIVTYQTYHNYPIESFYLLCFAVTVSYFIYSMGEIKKESKLERLEEYQKTARCFRVFLIIFTVIFTKNIENAI